MVRASGWLGNGGANGVASASAADNVLAPGNTIPVTIQVSPFGDTPGFYYLKAGYNSAPLNGEPSYWLLPLALPTSLTVS